MIFVEGYALTCALGESAKRSVEALKSEPKEPNRLADGNRYYFFREASAKEYYQTIEAIAKEAILDANLNQEEINNLGLFIGTSSPKLPLYEAYLKKETQEETSLYVYEVTQKLAHALEIKGFKTLISTACTSSANALVQAKEMIASGLIEKALILGVEFYNELSIKGFESFLLLSKDKIAPFDKNRNGVILGEGISAVILGKKKSLFRVASGVIHVDTNAITSPRATSLEAIMRQSIKEAHIEPNHIQMVKAHATATLHNDEVEAQALKQIFTNNTVITSFKPYLGHTMGACGTNELVLLMEALKDGFMPKTLNFSQEDPKQPLTPLLYQKKAKEGHYLLNNFAFGGNNCCVVLEFQGAF